MVSAYQKEDLKPENTLKTAQSESKPLTGEPRKKKVAEISSQGEKSIQMLTLEGGHLG